MALPHLIFDVNETLLDLASLDAPFARAFGDAAVRETWFRRLLALSLAATVTNRYVNFTTLAEAALTMVSEAAGITLGAGDRDAILHGMCELRPHPEVRDALARLRGAGFHLSTLTNSTLEAALAQLAYADLNEFFEQVFSVDDIRRYKPHPDTYRMAAAKLGIEPGGMVLIAAHDWDVAGAMAAGSDAAFIARNGAVPNPLAPPPPIVGEDLSVVAEALIARVAA